MLCPSFLDNGICPNQSECPYEHRNFFCDTCACSFTSQAQYGAHFAGHQHKRAERAASRSYANAPRRCIICSVRLCGPTSIRQHEQGRAHTVRLQDLAQRGIQYAPQELYPVDEDAVFHCDICDSMEWSGREAHLRTIRHKNKEAYTSVRAALDEAEKDKYGICVSHGDKDGVDFGIIDTNTHHEIRLTITSTIPNTKYLLLTVKLSSSYYSNARGRDSSFSTTYRGSEIAYGNVKEILLSFHSSDRGRFQDRLELSFYDSANAKRFAITRTLLCIVGNREDYEAIKPSAPYKPKHKKAREAVGTIDEGPKPPAIADIKWEVELKLYNVPKELERVLKMDDRKAKIKSIRDYMPREFTCETYTRQFHTLLHIEEHKSAVDLQRYDEEAVTLDPAPQKKLYYLTVPGLAEKRPSVIVGDKVLVKNHGSPSKHWFAGYVHTVELLSVGLRFSPNFNSFRGQMYDIRFCLGRIPLRRMHQALDSPFLPPRLLFPFESHIIRKRKPSENDIRLINPINRLIGANEMQKLAVTAIRNLEPGSPPFVVFGPPGTGKTVTIIEAIRQILLKDPEACILACAPSNSATDLIAERLAVLGPLQLFRMNAPSRSQATLPKALDKFSLKNANGTFCIPTKADLMRFRVVVSTCISACVPYNIGVPRGHFTHIFVDEAGQAAEPEAMIPIKTMSDGRTNIILSGDPKQLGPIVRSDLAVTMKLGVSYLDRLCESQVYNESQMNGITVVKLLKNFRSHKYILSYPNEKFYKGELQTCADPAITQSCISWSELPTRGIPIIFHAMQGKDEREASSPSFFNVMEASEVKTYIQMLKQERRLALNDEDIGVITPYHSQAGKIKTLLRKFKAEGVKVGSVEEFQGQERRVIIISTVRSSMDFVLSDIRHSLGFVAQPRRFNVAITRAKSLLIVIGDPRVLSMDPLWRGFLNYVYKLGAWKGKPTPDWDTDRAVEDTTYDVQKKRQAQAQADQAGLMYRITEAVEGEHQVDDLENEGHQEDAVVVERPWREAE